VKKLFLSLKKIIYLFKLYINYRIFLDNNTKKYINHNKKIWKNFKVKKNEQNKKNIILVDLFYKNSLIHFWSYITNVLAKKTDSQIKYFYIELYKSKASKFEITQRILKKIYNSFNASEGISEHRFLYSNSELSQYEKKFHKINNKKKNLINFSIDNVKLGDLICDSYLRATMKPTVDMRDPYLKKIFFKSLKFYFVSKEYFNKNNIIALIPSHVCFYYGIIARIAAKNNIPIIKVNSDKRGNKNFRINIVDQKYVNEEPPPYFYFKKIFKKFSVSHKKKALSIGKKILKNRLGGNYDSTLPYMKISQFNKNLKKTKLINKNTKKKIFIFPHCYFDNVHRYRYILFNDFADQINFLLKLSKKYPNYEWYYKPHTHDLGSDKLIHDKMLKDYPNIIRLDAKVGHNQIIDSKPFCIITNHGTVGHEYAAFKIPVIFTGDNKHINYKFGLHAKSKGEIESAIMNDKLFKKKITYNKNDLYEFMYLYFIYFQNLYGRKKLIKDSFFSTDNLNIADKSECFKFIIKKSKISHHKIIQYIENMINSGDIKLDHKNN